MVAAALIPAAIQATVDRRALNKAEGELDGFTERSKGRFSRIGGLAKSAALGVGVIGAAAVTAGVALVSNFVASAREIQQFSDITGVSTTALQQWSAIAGQSGGSAEDVTDAIREMNLRLVEAAELGSGPALDALNILGVGLDDLADKTPEEQFAFLRDRLSEVEDEATRTFLAEELLGGASERLAGFVSLSADEIDKQTAALGRGAVKSEPAIKAAVQLGIAVDKTKSFVAGLINEGLGVLIPQLVSVFQIIQRDIIPVLDNKLRPIVVAFAQEYLPILKTVFGTVFKIIYEVVKTAVGFILNDLEFLWTTFSGIAELVSAVVRGDWTAAWSAVQKIALGALNFLYNKVKLVIGLVSGIFEVFGVDIGSIFSGIWDDIVGVARSIRRLFIEVLPHNIRIGINRIIRALEAFPNAFITGMNAIIRAWNGFSINTPSVKLLGKTVVPAVNWSTPNIGLIRKISIPRLQEGGVVVSSTFAQIGEGGEPEAIVPLSRAEEFGFGRGGGNTYVVNVRADNIYNIDDLQDVVEQGLIKNMNSGRTQLPARGLA